MYVSVGAITKRWLYPRTKSVRVSNTMQQVTHVIVHFNHRTQHSITQHHTPPSNTRHQATHSPASHSITHHQATHSTASHTKQHRQVTHMVVYFAPSITHHPMNTPNEQHHTTNTISMRTCGIYNLSRQVCRQCVVVVGRSPRRQALRRSALVVLLSLFLFSPSSDPAHLPARFRSRVLPLFLYIPSSRTQQECKQVGACRLNRRLRLDGAKGGTVDFSASDHEAVTATRGASADLLSSRPAVTLP